MWPATLQRLGLTRATDLDGRFTAWAAAGLPVMTRPEPARRARRFSAAVFLAARFSWPLNRKPATMRETGAGQEPAQPGYAPGTG